MAKRPGVPEEKRAWQTNLTKNQHKQEISGQYQGHWLDVQPVPRYLQIKDSQASLQGIMISYSEQTKLRCPQLYTQPKHYKLLEIQEVDVKLEGLGVYIKKRYENWMNMPILLR